MPISRRPRATILAALLTVAALTSACGSASVPDPPAPAERGESLTVPHFAPDDPSVNTAGFVARTTRIDREVGETTFTLMIFAVGEVLTLGAMVNGRFDGTATWLVGDRSFSVPLSRSNRGETNVPVAGQALEGQHGGFDAFDWVNVDVPLTEWLPDGTRIRLWFQGDAGSVSLPSADAWFVSRLAVATAQNVPEA